MTCRVLVADPPWRFGRHSEKPDEFFEIVEKLCGPAMPATHVELFGRKLRPGWTVIGNEV